MLERLLHPGTDRETVKIRAFLQIAKEVGGLLIINRYAVIRVLIDIVVKMIPELLGITGPERGQERLLREQRVTGIGTTGQLVHQETLDIPLVGIQVVVVVHHQTDGTILRMAGDSRRIADETLVLVSPVLEEERMLQQSQVLAGGGFLTIQDSTLGQRLQVLGTPAELNAHLRRETDTIVQYSILVIDKRSDGQHGTHTPGGVVWLRAVFVKIHLAALTTKTAQGQVLHHHNGTGRLVLLTGSLLQHAFPVELLDVVLHGQFAMEVLVLEPEVEHAESHGGQHDGLHNDGLQRLGRGLHGNQGQHDEEQCQQIIRNVIGMILVCDVEKGKTGVIDVRQVRLIVDKAVTEQRHGNGTQERHHGVGQRMLPQPPRPDRHQQRGGETVNAHQRIA